MTIIFNGGVISTAGEQAIYKLLAAMISAKEKSK